MDDNKDVNIVPRNVVNKGLEDSRSVSQTEGHDEVFKVPQMGVKPRLPFIPLSDTDQMVCIAQVEFGEDHGMREGIKGGTKEGNGVLILYRDGV